jgi:hypothetical protein
MLGATESSEKQNCGGLSNRASTFIIDREGIIRFESRSQRNLGRPPVGHVLKTIDGFKKR